MEPEAKLDGKADKELRRAGRLIDARNLADARRSIDRAEALGAVPEACAGARWMISMLEGDFETAWRESDRIRALDIPDPHRFWQGEDLRGQRVMLRSLHGFGDAVQMLRYLPALQQMASEVTVQVAPRLVPLAACFDGVGRVTTWGEGAGAEPEWDVQVEVMELPHLFRTTVTDLPMVRGYLHLPPEQKQIAQAALGEKGRPRVGLVWSAGEWNPMRSVSLDLLTPLLELGSAEFWSLQGAGADPEGASLRGRGLLRDLPLCREGVLPLAAVIATLDLVITVDTLAAHLAGALERPAWVLLRADADWRWLAAGDRSPWYPSLRLWRCGPNEGWAPMLERVRQELMTCLIA